MLLFEEGAAISAFLEHNWPTLLGYVVALGAFVFSMGKLKKTIDDLTASQDRFHADLKTHSEDDRKAHDQMNGLQAQLDAHKGRVDRYGERQEEDRGTLREAVRLLDIHIKTTDIHVNPKYDYSKHEDLMRRLGGMEDSLKSLASDVARLDKKVAIVLAKQNMQDDG